MLQRLMPFILLSIAISALAEEPPAPVEQLNTQTFWFANSFGGGKDNKWMQLGIQDIFVFPDGRIVTNTGWDEAGRAIGFYKDADVLGSVKDYTALTGGVQVTADDQFIFALRAERKKLESDPFWFGVARYTLDGQPAKWEGGEGRVGNVLFLNPPKEKSNEWQSLSGVAVHNRELFLAEPLSKTIKVFGTADMVAKGAFKLTPETSTPGKMVAGKDGVLWIVQQDNAKISRIRAYSVDGRYLGLEIADVEKPTALAFNLAGHLLVCDGGKRQNIRRYDLAGKQPKLAGTFGQEGGVYAGKKPGAAAPDRFAGPTGVGVDAIGNTYVATNGPGGGAKLIAFDPKGKHRWTLEGLEFVDGADPDPANLTMAYTKDSAYKLDYAKPTGSGWPHAGWEHAAWTIDPFRYPNDPRLHVRQEGPKVFRRNGGLFLACSFGDCWTAIYRFDGFTAVPAAMFSKTPNKDFPPNNPITNRAWMWVDKNADGDFQADEFDAIAERSLGVFRAQFVDDDGTYWLGELNPAIVHRFPLETITKQGVPVYSTKSRTTTNLSKLTPDIQELRDIKCVAGSDSVFAVVYSQANPKSKEWCPMGREVRRYDNFSKEPKLGLAFAIPYDDDKRIWPISMAVAGEYVFIAFMQGGDASHKLGEIYVYSAEDGTLAGALRPTDEVGRHSGWIDFQNGALNARMRNDGTYVIFAEEDARAKVLYYQWKP